MLRNITRALRKVAVSLCVCTHASARNKRLHFLGSRGSHRPFFWMVAERIASSKGGAHTLVSHVRNFHRAHGSRLVLCTENIAANFNFHAAVKAAVKKAAASARGRCPAGALACERLSSCFSFLPVPSRGVASTDRLPPRSLVSPLFADSKGF